MPNCKETKFRLPYMKQVRGARLLLRLLGIRQWCRLALGYVFREPIIHLKLRQILHPVFLRPRTTDILVLWSVFGRKECSIASSITPSFIIDGGAYVGYTSIFFATQFPGAQIIAIEPDAENYKLLKDNTSNYSNITAINAALSSKEGRAEICNAGAAHWARKFKRFDAANLNLKEHCIQAITVDSIIDKAEANDQIVVKLDIEGAEDEVMLSSGDGGWMGKVAEVCVEIHKPQSRTEIAQYMKKLGFSHEVVLEKYHFIKNE